MPNPGSYTFFGNLVVNWSFNSSKNQLTVDATLNGKSIGSTVLQPGQNTGQLQGTEGGQTGTVDLTAAFGARTLQMNAQETNPTRSGTHTSDF